MSEIKATFEFLKNRVGAAFLLAAVGIFAACGGNRASDPYISVPDKGVTVEDVALKPDEYVGKKVTVAGTVKDTFGERAFLLHGEKLVDELLAVGADPYPDLQTTKWITGFIRSKPCARRASCGVSTLLKSSAKPASGSTRYGRKTTRESPC